MSRDQRQSARSPGGEADDDDVREIHAVAAMLPPPASSVSSGQFTTMSREFNAMVLAGTTIPVAGEENAGGRDGEEEIPNLPLAIIPDGTSHRRLMEETSLEMVKREEVETKISSWQTAKVAKINSRFKREDVAINGWESERVEKAAAALKKVERKLEEKRARAQEKMENEVAKAKQKAEEKRASAEAKRAANVVRVMDMANLMRVLGKAPAGA